MTSDEIIDIHGCWTSRDGKNKIHIVQVSNKFEGYVGTEDVKISLGHVSERTLNFKQTWHKGLNKGAVVTVYGKLTSDNSTIILEFDGMRANGRGMKGKNAIFRENLIGSWAPMGMSGIGDVWRLNMKNRRDITGYYKSKLKGRVVLKGQRNDEDINLFTLSIQAKDGEWQEEKIKGEFMCPNLKLALPPALGQKTILLRRKLPENMPKYEEYDPLPIVPSDSEVWARGTSFSSQKRPYRDESRVMYRVSRPYSEPPRPPEDLRTTLLPTKPPQKTKSSLCCTFL